MEEQCVGVRTEAKDSSRQLLEVLEGFRWAATALDKRRVGRFKVTQWEGCLFVVERIRGGRLRKARQSMCSAEGADRRR